MNLLRILLTSLLSIVLPISLQAEPLYKVGVSVPLTGEGAVWGEDIRNILQFAKKRFGDTDIELLFQDDKCAGKEGATAAHYFVQQKITAAVGYACVEAIMSAIPVLRKSKVPVISVLASGPEITGEGKGVFNLYPSDDLGVKVLIDRLKTQNIRTVLVLTSSPAFPQGITNAFRKQIAGSNDFNAEFIEYPENTADFRSLLVRQKGRKYDAVFINYSSVSEFIAFVKQRAELQLSIPLYTSYLNGLPTIKEQGVIPLIEGVEFYDTASIDAILQPSQRALFDEYVKEYGHLKSLDGYFAFVYNGYVAFRTALREGKGGDIESYLRTRTFSEGVGGPFRFNVRGEVEGGPSFVINKIVNGATTLVGTPLRGVLN